MLRAVLAIIVSYDAVPSPSSRMLAAEHYLYYFAEDIVSPDDGRYAYVLDRFARRAVADGATLVIIDLHEDSYGSDIRNQHLTEQRGRAAKSRLIALGIDETIIRIRAHGEARPPVPAPAGVAEPLNRLMYLDYQTR